MKLVISKKIQRSLGSLALAAVLFLSIVWGAARGKEIAQAQITVQTAQTVSTALHFFYQDQNRYPSAEEFSDKQIMLNYLSNFPLPQFVSQTCSQSFTYQTFSQSSFELNFCLPAATGNYQTGWNKLTGSPPEN